MFKTTLPLFPVAMLTLGTVSPSHAAEKYGSWTNSNMIEYNDLYISKVMSQLPGRVERLKAQTGEEIELDYRFKPEDRPDSDTGILNHQADILDDLERISKELRRAESRAARDWEKKPKVFGTWEPKAANAGAMAPAPAQPGQKKKVFDVEITAERLAVVLDTSPSMRPHLDTVRKEILKSYPHALMIETRGSYIMDEYGDNRWCHVGPSKDMNPFLEDFYPKEVETSKGYLAAVRAQNDAGSAVLALAELGGVDAIYWFSDFDDPMPDIGKFERRYKDTDIPLYLHSSGGAAPRSLMTLARRSDGAYLKELE